MAESSNTTQQSSVLGSDTTGDDHGVAISATLDQSTAVITDKADEDQAGSEEPNAEAVKAKNKPPPWCDDRISTRAFYMVRCVHFLHPKTNKLLHDSKIIGKMTFRPDDHMQIIRLWLHQAATVTDSNEEMAQAVLLVNHKSLTAAPILEKIAPETATAIVKDLDMFPRAQVYTLKMGFNQAYLANEKLFLGTPSFAESLAQTIKSEGELLCLFVANSAVERDLDQVTTKLMKESVSDPIMRWHDPSKRRIVFQKGQFSDKYQRPIPSEYKYVLRYSFRDWEDYATVYGFGMHLEQKFVGQQVTNYGAHPTIMYPCLMPGGSDQEWMVVVPVPGADEPRVRAGDTLKVLLDVDKADWNDAWPARVTEPIPYMPFSVYTAILRRPWDKENARWADDTKIQAFDLKDLHKVDPASAYLAILKGPKMLVRVSTNDSDKCYSQNVSALERLNRNDAEDMKGKLQSTFRDLLPATRLDFLPTYDLFASVRDQFPTVEDSMSLNAAQLSAVQYAAEAKGGLLNIHGPPGTGKSYFIRECAAPFLCHDERRPILVLSATNAGVDDLARTLQMKLDSLQEKDLAPEWKYIVRVHSRATTESIATQIARIGRGEPVNSRPKLEELTQEEEDLFAEIKLAQDIYDIRHDQSAAPFPLINDPRVQDLEGSLGHTMLQMAGIVEGGPNAAERFEHFVEAYENYRDPDSHNTFTPEVMKTFTELVDDLRDFTLSNAAIVCATISCAGAKFLQTACQANTRAIFVDEAGRQDECSQLPLFSTPYEKLDGIVLVADLYQLSATLKTDPSKNPFSKQLSVSLFGRLMGAGFPCLKFVEQHRSVPQISAVYNKLVYRTALRDTSATQIENRQLARDVQDFNRRTYRAGHSIVYLDVADGGVNKTKLSNSGSRYNEYYIVTAFNLIELLLAAHPTATIAFCTPYAAQARLAKVALAAMYRAEVPNVENVQVVTWDSSQGLEWDIGIVDIPITDTVGFCGEMARLNVAFSRWRMGYYVLANKAAITRAGKNNRWLPRFHDALLEYRIAVTEVTEYPSCKYYVPGKIKCLESN